MLNVNLLTFHIEYVTSTCCRFRYSRYIQTEEHWAQTLRCKRLHVQPGTPQIPDRQFLRIYHQWHSHRNSQECWRFPKRNCYFTCATLC